MTPSPPESALPVAIELDPATFEAEWAAHRARRYDYALNRALFTLYGVLLIAFWGYWAVELATTGFAADLVILAGVFALVTVFLVSTSLYWHFVRRTSGVVCTPERLVWRYGRRIYAAPWDALSVDRIGLTEPRGSNDAWVLTVLGRPLPLFGPHLRLKNLELFLAMALMTLNERGAAR